MEVIYEDNHLIAVNKTCREIVQGDKTGDQPLSEMLKAWLKKKYAKPGNVFIGVAHRLDRPVSGVVLFAKTSKALARLNTMFRDGKVKKTYWAIVKNRPPKDEDEVVNWLVRNENQNKSFAFDNEECETGVRCVAAPIRDYSGKITTAVSVSGPVVRMTDAHIARHLPCLLEAAGEISRLLGFSGESWKER